MTSQVEVPTLTGLIHFISGKRRVKLFGSEIQDGRHGGHLETLFFAYFPEPKGQLI